MGSRKYIGNKYQKVILTQIFPPDRGSVVIPVLLRHSLTAQILPVGVVVVVRVWRLADRRGLLHVSPSLAALPSLPFPRRCQFRDHIASSPPPPLRPSALC